MHEDKVPNALSRDKLEVMCALEPLIGPTCIVQMVNALDYRFIEGQTPFYTACVAKMSLTLNEPI